jgi:plasmid stability protein
MSQNLQVRNLSDETHRALKARAAREGRSLSDLVREELDRVAPGRRAASCSSASTGGTSRG